MRRSRTAGLLGVGVSLLLAPVLLAGPAMADDTVIDEPPGGAVCAPEIPATDCQQESPAPAPTTQTPAESPTPSAPAAETPAAPPAPTPDVVTIPVTGGSPSAPSLARTGAGPSPLVGAAGAVLLLAGAGLVAVGRRRTP